MIIDSNIIIYASKFTYPSLLSYLKKNESSLTTSAICKIEVLGHLTSINTYNKDTNVFIKEISFKYINQFGETHTLSDSIIVKIK